MAYNWTFCGFGGAGLFQQMYADPTVPGKLWTVCDVSGVWVSLDSGDNWTIQRNEGMQNMGGSMVIQAPTDANIMYHAAGRQGDGAIESSTDAGANWTNHGYGTAYNADSDSHKCLAVKLDDANTAYFGTTNGNILRTTNRTTWSEWKSAASVGLGRIEAMVIDKTNTYLWVGSKSGLRRITLSDGTVQTHTLSGTNSGQCRDIVANTIAGQNYIWVAAGHRIAYTTTNGTSWNYGNNLSGMNSGLTINRFAIQPGANLGSTKVMCAWTTTGFSYNGGRQKSDNGTGTWTNATGTVNVNMADDPSRLWESIGLKGVVMSMEADPFVPNRFYASDFWGVFRTDDFGTVWNEKVKGAGNTVSSDLELAPDGTTIFSAAMDAGLVKTSNGGASWTQCIPNNTLGQGYPYVSGHYWRVVCTGTATDWANGQGHVITTNWPWDYGQNQVLRSTNNGNTWAIITAPANSNAAQGLPTNREYGGIWSDGYMRGLCKDPNNHNILYASIDGWNYTTNLHGGIFRSTDNGVTWARRGSPNGWHVYNALAVNPTNSNNIIFSSWAYWGCHYSMDGGATWTSVGDPYYVYKMKFASDGTAYACGDSAGPVVWRSTNGGANWSVIWHGNPTSGPGDGLTVHPTDPNTIFVGIQSYNMRAPNRVYMCQDAKAASPTFTDITGNLPNGSGITCGVVRLNEGTSGYLYVGRSGQGHWKLNLDFLAAPPSGGSLTSVNVEPATLVANAVGTATISFVTATTWPADGTLEVTFPSSLGSGYVLNSGGTSAAGGLSGIDGSLAVSVSGSTATFTRSGGTASAPGLKSCTLSFVKNPDSAGSTGSYSLRTTDTSSTSIDTGTASSDTITPEAPPVPDGVTQMQSKVAVFDPSGTAVIANTFNSATTTGNLIVAVYKIFVGDGDFSHTITDNKGNTYTQLGVTTGFGGLGKAYVAYCFNATGGSNHTVTLTMAGSHAVIYNILATYEVFGCSSTTTPQYVGASGTSSELAPGTLVGSTSDAWYVMLGDGGSEVSSGPTGWTGVATAHNTRLATLVSSGSKTPSMTAAGSNDWVAEMAVFEEASSGTPAITTGPIRVGNLAFQNVRIG